MKRGRSFQSAAPFQQTQLICRLDDYPLLLLALLLVVFQFVTTPMVCGGVEVDVPETNQPRLIRDSQDQLTISIWADGQVLIGPDYVPEDFLAARMTEIFSNAPEKLVTIQADRTLRYAVVQQALRSVRDAGFRRLRILTKRRGGSLQWEPFYR